MSFWFPAIVGGLITAIFLPFITYITIRVINYALTSVDIGNPIKNENHGYDTYSLWVKNRTLSTLKNVSAHIIIDFKKADIHFSREMPMFMTDFSKKQQSLSWAKSIEGKHPPSLDINQGEQQDINLIMYMPGNKLPLLQVASEQGFWNSEGAVGRVLLKLHKSYKFTVFITAENILPIKKKYIYDHLNNLIIKA